MKPVKQTKKKARKLRNCAEYTDKQVCEALTKANGLKSLAAKILNKDSAYISERAKNPTIVAHLEQLNQDRIDAYEEALDFCRDDKEIKAITFFLKHKAKSRGYADNPITQNQITSEEKWENLKALLIETLAPGKIALTHSQTPSPNEDEPIDPDE